MIRVCKICGKTIVKPVMTFEAVLREEKKPHTFHEQKLEVFDTCKECGELVKDVPMEMFRDAINILCREAMFDKKESRDNV